MDKLYSGCCTQRAEFDILLQAIYLMTDMDTEEVGEAPVTRTRDIFTKMDLNHDGVLSKEEFIKGCLNDETLFKLLACNQEE